MPEFKEFYCDLETSGLKEDVHGVVQIAGIIKINGQVKEKFDYKVKLMKGDKITPSSIEIHGYSIEEIKSFPSSHRVFNKLLETFNKYIDPYNKTDKFHLLGYNAQFDYKFLRKFFEKNNFKWFGSYVFFPPIDIMNLAAFCLKSVRHRLPDFKLNTVAQYFGAKIKEDSLHKSMYDIELTKFIYDKIESLLEEKGKT